MIVITTPTGDIGSQVLDCLLQTAPSHGEVIRVIARDRSRLPEAVRARVDVVTGSHGDADVLAAAFDGADAVFWVVPPNPMTPTLQAAFSDFTRPAARAFAEHGVERVVGVSALGRGTAMADRAGLVTASLEMDDLIAASGIGYRALANPSFMDNVLRQVDSIRTAGVFADTVAPDRAAPAVATRDIAAVAARLLLDRSWTGVDSVPVLGPEDLSAHDMARIMSEVLGTQIRYERRSYDDLRTQMIGRGLGSAFVDGMVDMMQAKDNGLDAGVARTPEAGTPTTFRQWCADVLLPAVETAAAD
ncbi:MAG: NAD(P)H-binding protein [Corynebacteriales bacterium]|uniref:NAD(P)H-binding protein n=1 Tax=Williamsia herbipolensis TaxID=1603258 RepID=A0AAU4JZ24_9NOCA|nr:NAD(P)H-binding protein [Williamsia herbipolensis]MCX6471940.1 NAD(P)H-binding protein [Mycobacteriales bacterium]